MNLSFMALFNKNKKIKAGRPEMAYSYLRTMLIITQKRHNNEGEGFINLMCLFEMDSPH